MCNILRCWSDSSPCLPLVLILLSVLMLPQCIYPAGATCQLCIRLQCWPLVISDWHEQGKVLASSCPHPLPPLGQRQPFCLLKPYSPSLLLSCYSPYSLNWGVYAVQDPLTHPQPSLLHVNLLSKHIHLCWQPATDKYQILMALPLAIGQVTLLTPSASSLVTSTVLS